MIGYTLHTLRKRKGVSQEELAAVLSVSQQTISAWENDAAEPDIRCLCALADFFSVSVDFIVGHEVKTDLTGQMRELLDSFTPEQMALLCGIAAGEIERMKNA